MSLKVNHCISDSSGIQSSLFSSLARDLKFSDPQYPKQWHLKNQRYIGNDCNVTSVWEYNITGKGVVVAVVDDGNVFYIYNFLKLYRYWRQMFFVTFFDVGDKVTRSPFCKIDL